MMIVGIIYDDVIWVNKIKDCIKEYFFITNHKDYEIITCLNIEKIDLLFLDVELKEPENGF